jgi:serine/threonine protein kinase
VRGIKRAHHIGRRLRQRTDAGSGASAGEPRIGSRWKGLRVTWAITGGLVQTLRGVIGLVARGTPVPSGTRQTPRTVGHGRYRLLSPAGTGGAGKLYVAHDVSLERTVAVKVLRPGHDEAARARLHAEARVAAGLSHHGIAQVLDYGEDIVDGELSPYIVMEYVEGVTLAEILRGGPLPAQRVADLLAQLSDALTAVHAAGVVHRDVKPANVMLTPTGSAVLLDFGVAREADAEPLTLTGTIVGTLNYISPEQAAGEAASPRSDLYSLGMVAYEALTGVRALACETQAATLLAHLSGTVEPLPVDVPPDLRALVEQLVQRDPCKRPADAAQVARRARTADRAAAAGRHLQARSTHPRMVRSKASGRNFRVAPRPRMDLGDRTWRLAEPYGPPQRPHPATKAIGSAPTAEPGGSEV